MLTEAVLTLPVNDNDGVSLEPQRIKIGRALVDAFGGFTDVHADGVWRDPQTGKMHQEEVCRLHIAGNWSEVSSRDKLYQIAQLAC